MFFLKRLFFPAGAGPTSRFDEEGVVADGVLGALVLGVLAVTDDEVTFDDARLNFIFGMSPLDFAVIGTGVAAGGGIGVLITPAGVGVVGEPKSPETDAGRSRWGGIGFGPDV